MYSNVLCCIVLFFWFFWKFPEISATYILFFFVFFLILSPPHIFFLFLFDFLFFLTFVAANINSQSHLAQIWMYKVMISILPPIVIAPVLYILFGYFIMMYIIWYENRNSYDWWARPLYMISFTIFGNALGFTAFTIGATVIVLLSEILCFTLIAGFVFLILTSTRWKYHKKYLSQIVKEMLDFISNSSRKVKNDRVVRIACLNYAYYITYRDSTKSTEELYKFLTKQKETETLSTVTYKQLRDKGGYSGYANIFSWGFRKFLEVWKEYKKQMNKLSARSMKRFVESMIDVVMGTFGIVLVYIFLPLYILSRICTILYPYYLVFYIYYYDLFFKLNPFELTMLGVYIFLQLVVFIFCILVFRTHWWLWHILPGQMNYNMNWRDGKEKDFFGATFKYYDEIQWLPYASTIVVDHFGNDIGGIIVDYLIAMNQIKM